MFTALSTYAIFAAFIRIIFPDIKRGAGESGKYPEFTDILTFVSGTVDYVCNCFRRPRGFAHYTTPVRYVFGCSIHIARAKKQWITSIALADLDFQHGVQPIFLVAIIKILNVPLRHIEILQVNHSAE